MSPGETVHLVEHQHGDIRVPRKGAQVALVQRRVGVLLRVEHPDDDVHQPQQAVHLLAVTGGGGVVVGQVDQDKPVEALPLDVAEDRTVLERRRQLKSVQRHAAGRPGRAEP